MTAHDSSGSDGMVEVSRRQLLQAGGAALAATSVAGCSGLPFGGGFSYASWMYPPGEAADVDHYGFRYLQPSAVDENEDEYDEATFDSLEAMEDRFAVTGVDFDEVDHLLLYQNVIVLDGSFDNSDVTEELEDNGIEEDDTVNGYTIFLNDEETRAAAVKGSTVALAAATGSEDGQDMAELLVETKAGDGETYADASEAFSTLKGHLGSGTFVTGGTGSSGSGSTDITYGQTVSGALETTDDSQSGYYTDTYQFYGTEGDTVRITMDAPNGDTFLILNGPDGGQVASNDDYDVETYNSRITTQLPATGVYEIVCTSYDAGVTFDYQLKLEGIEVTDSAAAGRFENAVAQGSTVSVDGDTAERTWAIVFESEGDVDTDAVEEWTQADEQQFGSYDDLSVEADGRTALVTGTIDTDELTQPL